MKYGKWKLDFSADSRYGIGPDEVVFARGDSIEGAFFDGDGDAHNFIYGYLNDGFDFTDLEAWQVTEVSQAEMLQKTQERNGCFIADNGRVVGPQFE